MSLGGRDEVSPAVIVYGPDGTAYGSPAQARAAGVSNPTMSPPAGVPISYPGRQPYMSAPMPYIPTPSSGGRNRYAEIMANYQQALLLRHVLLDCCCSRHRRHHQRQPLAL